LAQGLGWALNIPLIPVNTLLALAYIHHETLEEGSRLLAAIDARMHECYCAVFRYENHEFKEVTAPALCKPSELLAIADDNGAEFLCGNAFRIYADEIGDPAPKKLLSTDDVNAQMIVPLARKYFEENKTVDAAEASPLYVRDHVALTIEERKAEKSR
jgi:tRNA threonylcarbamoyladenosine biosynthesis protein TsaB